MTPAGRKSTISNYRGDNNNDDDDDSRRQDECKSNTRVADGKHQQWVVATIGDGFMRCGGSFVTRRPSIHQNNEYLSLITHTMVISVHTTTY
jgi:hypothetical protein